MKEKKESRIRLLGSMRLRLASLPLLMAGVLLAIPACSDGELGNAPSTTSQATTRAGLRPAPDKATATQHIPDDLSNALVVVKFHEGTGVSMRGSTLRSGGLGSRATATTSLTLARVQSDLRAATQRLSERGRTVKRHFALPAAKLAELRERGERRSGRRLADLSTYFDVAWDGGSRQELVQLLEDLNSLASVEIAYVQPPPQPAQVGGTPDFTPLQGYTSTGPNGIGVAAARAFAGGRGQHVDIIDIEERWTTNHEDLPAPFYFSPDPGPGDEDHGTGVAGIMVGLENDYGVTGIAPQARIGYASHLGTGNGVTAAMENAIAELDPGDVMVLEMQFGGPETDSCACGTNCCNCVPTEYFQSYFDLIETATASGIMVVQAAGNGEVNLDDPVYSSRFDRSVRDSGAILVGASASSSRTPACWTNFGSRIDLHAWGENVVTTGGGNLYNGPLGEEDDYTSTFGGTSSATPIVAGAVALLQSIAQEATGAPLGWQDLRDLLVSTGTPQSGDLDRPIGPLPNLVDAAPLVGGAPSCGDGTCSTAEDCATCPDDCGPCAGCVPDGCEGAASVDAPYSVDGPVDTCVFFDDASGNINSWNMSLVAVNGVDLTNRWVHSSSYPATCDGGYYARLVGGYSWSHFELR